MNQAVIERLRGELSGLREQGLYKSERVLAGPQGGVVRAGERDVINLCANNYLGLANHPVVRAAAQRDRKSTRLNSSHTVISYAVFCLKKKRTARSAFTLASVPSPACVRR